MRTVLTKWIKFVEFHDNEAPNGSDCGTLR